jgi:hypothetical protein
VAAEEVKELEARGIKVVKYPEVRTPTTWKFKPEELGFVPDNDHQPDNLVNIASTTVQRARAMLARFKSTLRSLIFGSKESEAVASGPRILWTSCVDGKYPRKSQSLERTIRDIGMWTDWCHMSVEERMGKITAMMKPATMSVGSPQELNATQVHRHLSLCRNRRS